MRDRKFDFDDILIEPSVTTTVNSRYDDIELKFQLPLFTAPMDTVVDLNNTKEFIDLGINVCLPRTIHYYSYTSKYLVSSDVINYYNKNIFPSIGLKDQFEPDFIKFIKRTPNILIDVANGHMEQIIDMCDDIRCINPEIKIMVGNIANPETYHWYAESDLVDYIRVGIGNGGGCLTTKQSGVGYPMASLIHEMYKIKREFVEKVEYNRKNNTGMLPLKQYNRIPAIVADGGMKDYADVVKALALGADYVMLGSIFNKCVESCATSYWHRIRLSPQRAKKLFKKGYTIKKYFRGMSTKGAQKSMGKSNIKTSEGVVRYREVEYTLNGWVENFEHYLRNAMSYTGAKTLVEFIGKANFSQITTKAYDRFNK